ncbi:MAG TPA: acyl-CoA dehydrogenase family protein, partial [Roseiarcus sp.]|nr:acyl-CoA dehydrogenase family protein [Roseiarcus sp.]
MEGELTEEQNAIREMALEFARTKLAPHALEWDEKKTLPIETLREAARLGMGGVTADASLGGSGLGRFEAAIIFEALATGCPTISAFLSIHNMAVWMIDAFGAEAFRRKVVPDLAAMNSIASYCLTEPGAGSDAAALSTRATREGDVYVVNGVKQFISGAGASDWYVTMTRTGGAGASGVTALAIH